ncbi:recombinase family protein [Streptomyces sp. DSM 44917]|uniref:Recombinase family protein n=1 Tax=Streptomyces boetiae TaxID=3075541 RepID=A0ABU2L7A6_9ACTN|nr:recombinase family protein [Streptomyces sp. DSM 44917]MDT0307207.1 recombinase family protein [Streptomyces sp. DSM 44917]
MIRLAFAGRTSTYDQQDPTLSIPRQLRSCQQVLPEDAFIVVHFYDVESGRMDLADRGRGRAHELFQIPIPRDGGIQELLEEAERPDRRFDAVICESIDRISRRTYIGTEIEHRLEQLGVKLLAADEPINLGGTGRVKTATQVLTRRMKQGVAEWYVTEMLEKSWDGFQVHAEHGYNVGMPCYGYQAKRIPHPVPAKRAKGLKKTLLEVHPIQGPVVRKAFAWRVTERLGYQAIADRLNLDLIAHPPPTPVEPERAVGRWTASNVRDMLTNPKHTGHMVWNRRARKGKGKNRANPVEEWVWSPEPTHEALVDLETFVQAQQVGERRERTRTAAGSNKHPDTKRIYPLRGFMFCTVCGRRYFGKTPHPHVGTAYMVCNPKKQYRPEDHPTSFWVREDSIMTGLNDFLATQVFGEARHHLLDRSLRMLDTTQRQEREERLTSLRRAIRETETKSKRLLRNMELVDEPDQEFIRDINERRAELRAQREALREELVALEDEAHRVPNPDLLNRLPVTPVDLAVLPDDLSRRLFEVLRLEIHYDGKTNQALCRITLTADTIEAVSRTTRETATAAPVGWKNGADHRHNMKGKRTMNGRNDHATICVVPPAGFEPAHTAPEGMPRQGDNMAVTWAYSGPRSSRVSPHASLTRMGASVMAHA